MLRRLFSPATRIAIGLSGAVLAVCCIAKFLGVLPDKLQEQTAARVKVAESIAMSCTALLVTEDFDVLESYLAATVSRDDDLLSCAIRNEIGELALVAGDHTSWVRKLDETANAQLQVPLLRSSNEKWGDVELRFRPLRAEGWQGVWQQLDMELMLFIGLTSFLFFSFILRFVLKQLDPSKAVPQRVREALNNLAEGLMIVDAKFNILLVNHALARVLRESADMLIGLKSSKIAFQSLEDDEQRLPWAVCLEENRPISNFRIGLQGRDGEERHYAVNCSVLHGHNGKQCGVMITLDDITLLEKSRVALQQARDAADAANQAKSDFLANMSHEIRTPMNAILGFTDVLRRGMEHDRDQQLEYLNTIHSSGNHLIELINDILDLSKVEAGKLDLERKELSLPEIVHQTVRVLAAKAQEKQIRLDYEIEGRIPNTIVSDPTRLRQILMNLTGNAIKFTEEGGVGIRVSVQADTVRFDVVDSGIGIPQQQLAKIFSPFSQADSSVTRRFGGTGLGLSICKRFAEALGGSISVRSQVGKGSVFSVQIPVLIAESARWLDHAECRDAAKQALNKANQNSVQLTPGCRVLVVDDGATNRQLVSVVLKRQNIEVTEAENGKQAVDFLQHNQVDAVLMDVQMPVMDGQTATQTLREMGDQTPIIALTGNAMQGERQKCLDAGFSDYLPKPIEIDKLLVLLGQYLGTVEGPPMQPKTIPESPIDSREMKHTTPKEKPPETIEPWTSTLPMDDPEFRQIVEHFLGTLNQRIEEMKSEHAKRNFERLVDLGHWLKGAGGTVGLNRFNEPGKLLETYAKDEDWAKCGRAIELVCRLNSAIDLECSATPS